MRNLHSEIKGQDAIAALLRVRRNLIGNLPPLPAATAFHIFCHTYGTWMRRYGKLDTRGACNVPPATYLQIRA